MKLTEITGSIENGMWCYGDEMQGKAKEMFAGPKIMECATVEKDGMSAHRLDLSIITGTYLETAASLFPGTPNVDEISLKEFFLECAMIKIPDKSPCSGISVAELEKANVEVKPNDCLVLFTGWYKRWNKKGFVADSPHFTQEAMAWIVSKKVKVLAADIPCYHNFKDPVESKEFPQLNLLYRSGALTLAPIVNGDQVKPGRAKIVILPLKIKGVCASPTRAVIIE